MVTQFQKYIDDPRELVRQTRARRLAAMRSAVAGYLPASVRVENLIVDDELEPDSRPIGKDGQVRRLFSSRLALHAASRIETRLQARQFLLALGVLIIAMFVSGGMLALGGGRPTTYAMTGISTGLILLGGYLIYLASGFSGSAYTRLLGMREILTDDDLRDARDFANRVLLRATPVDAPADLQDVYRPLTVDADGNPVDGQVVASDYSASWLSDALGNGLIVYGILGVALLSVGLVGMDMPVLAGLLGVPLAVAGLGITALRLFLLPPITARRAIEAQEALRRSPTAKLVDQVSPAVFRQLEIAKTEQVAAAIADNSPVITLGTAVGLLADRRDPLAPSHAGLPYGLSVSDLSTHLLVVGATGSGKTAAVLRPVIGRWAEVDAGGILVLDGKGVLPAEVSDLPNFKVITPGESDFAPIENLTADQVADALLEMFGSDDAADPFWQQAAAEYIRSVAKVLALLVNMTDEEDMTYRWTLAALYRLAVTPGVAEEVKGVIEGKFKDNFGKLTGDYRRAYDDFTRTFPGLPDATRNSILQNANVWLGTLVNSSALAVWADADSGVPIEDTLDGARIGLLLPEFKFGKAGAVISNFAKRRFYEAVKRRGESWKTGSGTRVLLVVDECQALMTDGEAEILPIARSLGLSALFATQNVDGLQIALQDKPALLEQILGQFRSVIGLAVNTDATCSFLAARLGATARPVYSEVPTPVADAAGTITGLQQAAGAYRRGTMMAAASASSEVSGLRGRGLAGEAFEMLGKLADKVGLQQAYKLLPAALTEGEKGGSARLGTHENITPEEVRNLTAQKFTALAVVNRGGVDRRDLIKLEPVFSFAKAQEKAA